MAKLLLYPGAQVDGRGDGLRGSVAEVLPKRGSTAAQPLQARMPGGEAVADLGENGDLAGGCRSASASRHRWKPQNSGSGGTKPDYQVSPPALGGQAFRHRRSVAIWPVW